MCVCVCVCVCKWVRLRLKRHLPQDCFTGKTESNLEYVCVRVCTCVCVSVCAFGKNALHLTGKLEVRILESFVCERVCLCLCVRVCMRVCTYVCTCLCVYQRLFSWRRRGAVVVMVIDERVLLSTCE